MRRRSRGIRHRFGHAQSLVSDMAPEYFEKHRFPKWNREVSVLHEPRLMKRIPAFAKMTKAEHLAKAHEFQAKARVAKHAYNEAVKAAVAKHGEKGPIISGAYQEHFPEDVKDQLRELAHKGPIYSDAALAHWKNAGKRTRLEE